MTTDFDFTEFRTASLQSVSGQQLINIERHNCTASVALQGGQVLAYAPHGQRPLLWHNSRLELASAEPMRQGIPVCWPWFGELAANPEQIKNQFSAPDSSSAGLSNHGLVRTSEWELLTIKEHEQATEVLLMTSVQHPALRLIAKYSFGDELKISLTTENRGNAEVHFSCALHSYFAVSDIAAITIPDLDGVPYLDATMRWAKRVQGGDVLFDSEVDRAYYNTPAIIRIRDSLWHRTIVIESDSSHSAVVWNPWLAKSRRLTQFSSQAYKTMVCVETAKILRDAVSLEPGSSFSLRVKISIQN